MNVLTISPTKHRSNSKFSDEQLIELHSQGLSIGEMAKRLGVSRSPVCCRMKKLGLKANGERGGVPQYTKVGSEHFCCASCAKVKPLRQRHGKICCDCARKRYISKTTGALHCRYTQKKSVAGRKGIQFDLSFKDFEELFAKQGANDAYTGQQMSFDFGQGLSRATVTLDRVNNKGGYTRENVVLCCLGTNAKKGKRPVEWLFEQLEFGFPSEVSDDSQPKSKEETNPDKPL